ncbi:putative capsular polysaccharide phosphotransferase LcbA [Trichinella spiralis]|uniref:putative capsular polysaccharide phosphotransferase LcbA n=1 Tax=Trichinella spiralis TaxID=6334 RepID=UPI0001EFD7D9|nr:putative capsular polysaccharide phosphotransferase LcbA [Trichinella spiralis]
MYERQTGFFIQTTKLIDMYEKIYMDVCFVMKETVNIKIVNKKDLNRTLPVKSRNSSDVNSLVFVTPWLSLKAATVNNLSIVHFPFVLKSPLPTNNFDVNSEKCLTKGICVKSCVKLSEICELTRNVSISAICNREN